MALSWQEQSATAGQLVFNVNIEYLGKSDIHVELNNVPVTDFTWDSDTVIRLPADTVVAAGDKVAIIRKTNRDALRLLFAEGAAFTRDNLDEQNTQFLYLAQELVEGRSIDGFYGNISMNGYKLTDVGDPSEDADAANKSYVDSTVSAAQSKNLRIAEGTIPPITGTRRGKVLGFDSNSNPLLVDLNPGSAGDVMLRLADTTGASLIGTSDGTTVQERLDELNPELGVQDPNNLEGTGFFNLETTAPWGQVGVTFGDTSRLTMVAGRDGALKIAVLDERGQPSAEGVMMPTVHTMYGMQSATNVPYKLIRFPSDGFESDRKSPSMMYGCSDTGNPALYLVPPNSSLGKPADNWYSTDGYRVATSADTFPTRRITRSGGGYYKIATIPASTLSNVRGQFSVVGSWDRERLASRTELRINNFVGINWANAANYTAAQWSKFFKVVSDGALYDRTSAGRVTFGITVADGVISIYVFLPLQFYGEISSQGTRTLTLDYVVADNLVPTTIPAGYMALSRGNNFTSDNAGICSDGVIIPCDAHIRIAADADTTKTVRELTANNYQWIGSGTSNLPLGTAVSVTHTSTGVYTLVGVSGLWQSELRLRQPYDYDGNQVAIAEITGTTPVIRVYKIVYTYNSTTGVVTRGKGDLMDIPSNAWVDVFYSENWS